MANAAMIVDMCTRLLLETWVTKAQFRWGGACEPSQSKTTAVSVDSYFLTIRDAGIALIDRYPDTRFILDHLCLSQPRTVGPRAEVQVVEVPVDHDGTSASASLMCSSRPSTRR